MLPSHVIIFIVYGIACLTISWSLVKKKGFNAFWCIALGIAATVLLSLFTFHIRSL